nr:unnamed protein product [uncultured bacterium]
MKTEDVNEITGYELKEYLEKEFGLELTASQKLTLYDTRTRLYRRRHTDYLRKYGYAKFLCRITLPLYFIVSILCNFIIMPIKYMITGNYYFDTKTKVHKFMVAWYDNLRFI